MPLPPQAAAQLLSHFPPADLALGTPLRDIALEWLVPLPGSSGHAKRSWLELSLTRMLKRYTIAQRGSSISPSLDSPGGDTQSLNPRNLKVCCLLCMYDILKLSSTLSSRCLRILIYWQLCHTTISALRNSLPGTRC